MIIRSQDKKQIVNFDVCHLSITADHCIVATNGLVSYPSEILSCVIATYSTEEKAIKVLDMIQDAYCRMRASDCMTSGSMDNLVGFTEEKKATIIDGVRAVYVFQMPQDSEV